MKNISDVVKKNLISKYKTKDSTNRQIKTSNVNVLLNRISINNKNETKKKLYFSAAASTGLILFGLLIF